MVHKNSENIHQEAILGCMRGEKKAQFLIYELYCQAIYSTIYRLYPDKGFAEEIMQDSFLSAFNNIHTWNKSATFGAWLKKIAINKTIDELKKRKLATIKLPENFEFKEDTPTDEFINFKETNVKTIKDCIKSLKSKYRIVLSLYLFEGYDHQEIAEILCMSSANSRMIFSRAKQQLIKLINHKPKYHG